MHCRAMQDNTGSMLLTAYKGALSCNCPIADCRRDAAPVREEIFEIGNEGMSVAELSQRLALPSGEIVKTLFMKGIMVQVNQVRKHEKAFTLGPSLVTSHERACKLMNLQDFKKMSPKCATIIIECSSYSLTAHCKCR